MAKCVILALFFLINARYGDCLHCFQCHNVSEGIDCNVVAECNTDESCFVERSGHTDNDTQYSLGCIPRQNCPDDHQFTIVGRSVQSHCAKCCATNGCNKKYCKSQHPTAPRTTIGSCIDDPAENCSKLSAITNICATPHRAKDICRKYCGLCNMADGNWGQWNGWSPCSTSCGMGAETRTRQCNDPAPTHGGYDCQGNKLHQRSCFSRPCPVHGMWTGWAQWEPCSNPCGNGLKKRHRTCSNPPPSLYGQTCPGDNVEYSLCQGTDCGNHSTTSTQHPTGPPCDDVLQDCDTANKTLGVCNNFEAARKTCAEFCGLCGIVDGLWATWSLWTQCSTTCGPGTATRSRSCTNPPPQKGGKNCAGNATETKDCKQRACPVHGGWGHWANWAVCSGTCGTGITSRTRACDNPRPQLSGNYCFGSDREYVLCLIKECPVNGGWTEWSFWSSCSASCGNGHHIRQRSCNHPAPANGGLACPGSRTEQRPCNLTSCQVAKSAFTVTYPVAGPSNNVKFIRVITNIGSHYSTSTGIFTTVFSGIYVFDLHILKNSGTDFAECTIRKNQSTVAKAHTNPEGDSEHGYFSASTSVVIHLTRGDQVDVYCRTSVSSLVSDYTSLYNYFSGFLLQTD